MAEWLIPAQCWAPERVVTAHALVLIRIHVAEWKYLVVVPTIPTVDPHTATIPVSRMAVREPMAADERSRDSNAELV